MIKVRIWRDLFGNLEGRPLSHDWAHAFAQVVRENVNKNASHLAFFTFYFQGDDDLIRENVTEAAWKEIENGYEVIVLMDPWLVGHFYGYDAHCVAEGPLTRKGTPLRKRK